MKAMILAAGLGKRLRPLTDTMPKPLLPIAGRPLIEWNLLLLRRHGITQVVINLHHLADQIEQALGDGSRLRMELTYSREAEILGTGGGIKQAEPSFAGEPFLVLNGDTLFELDVDNLRRVHGRDNPLATMVLREDSKAAQWGVVEMGQGQQIVRINGRGRQDDQASAPFMFAGVHIMHPRLLRDVPVGRESSIIDAYIRAITAGEVIKGYRMQGYWSDLGTPERYDQAQRDIDAGRLALDLRESVPPAS